MRDDKDKWLDDDKALYILWKRRSIQKIEVK